jgi:hypothetical protein
MRFPIRSRKMKTIIILGRILCILVLVSACNFQVGGVSEEVNSDRPARNSVEVISTSISPDRGFLPGDIQVSVSVHYTLTEPEANLVVWFERFQDANCTIPGSDTDGNSTYGPLGIYSILAGEQETVVDLSLPAFDSPYAGLGVSIHSIDNANTLVENPWYLCYPVQQSTQLPGNWIGIVDSTPSYDQGLSTTDSQITLVVGVILLGEDGLLQIWFERFRDANCTELGSDPAGSSSIPGGVLQDIPAGDQRITLTMEPPLLDTEYVGVGARIWSKSDTTLILAAMPNYFCWRVNPASP